METLKLYIGNEWAEERRIQWVTRRWQQTYVSLAKRIWSWSHDYFII